MTVYADVLLVLNLIVDYFLLSLSAYILDKKVSLWRIVLSSAIGGVSSLYIFLPQMKTALEVILKISVCIVMCLVAFSYRGFKDFFRCFTVLTAISFLYGGFMIAIWYVFRPNGMIINNSVVYFNVSPVFLILFSVSAYLIIIFVRKVTAKSSTYSKMCKIDVIADKNKLSLNAIVDTGNSVEDVFSMSEIIIVDKSVAAGLFSGYPFADELERRYRVLPINTVSGTDLLDGYRCDLAKISFDEKIVEIKAPVLAVSKTPLNDGYEAIVNPKIFE